MPALLKSGTNTCEAFCVLIQVSKGNDGSCDASPLQHAARRYLANHPNWLFAPRSAYQEMLNPTSVASMPSKASSGGKLTDAKETLSTEVNFSFCCTFSASAFVSKFCAGLYKHMSGMAGNTCCKKSCHV